MFIPQISVKYDKWVRDEFENGKILTKKIQKSEHSQIELESVFLPFLFKHIELLATAEVQQFRKLIQHLWLLFTKLLMLFFIFSKAGFRSHSQ